MDLPADKKQAVLGSSDEKKRLMLRDQDKQLQAVPTKFYLSKFAYVLEADTVKVRVWGPERGKRLWVCAGVRFVSNFEEILMVVCIRDGCVYTTRVVYVPVASREDHLFNPHDACCVHSQSFPWIMWYKNHTQAHSLGGILVYMHVVAASSINELSTVTTAL